MKKLNKQATAVFARLLDKLGDNTYLKLTAENFMPLTLEVIGTGIAFQDDTATLYSLTHYYELNGDLMRDPEMCFLVIDLGDVPPIGRALFVYPQYYQQDNLGIYEESIRITNNQVEFFKPHWQKDHAVFANSWLCNISQQGFLE